MADARDLKSRGSDPVPVRPRSPAPRFRGVEQLVARRAHNPEAGGSSPPPATRKSWNSRVPGLFLSPVAICISFSRGVSPGVLVYQSLINCSSEFYLLMTWPEPVSGPHLHQSRQPHTVCKITLRMTCRRFCVALKNPAT